MTDRIRAAQRHAAKLEHEMFTHREAGTRPPAGMAKACGDAVNRVVHMVREHLRATEGVRRGRD
jgi:hypothetical protein